MKSKAKPKKKGVIKKGKTMGMSQNQKDKLKEHTNIIVQKHATPPRRW